MALTKKSARLEERSENRALAIQNGRVMAKGTKLACDVSHLCARPSEIESIHDGNELVGSAVRHLSTSLSPKEETEVFSALVRFRDATRGKQTPRKVAAALRRESGRLNSRLLVHFLNAVMSEPEGTNVRVFSPLVLVDTK